MGVCLKYNLNRCINTRQFENTQSLHKKFLQIFSLALSLISFEYRHVFKRKNVCKAHLSTIYRRIKQIKI